MKLPQRPIDCLPRSGSGGARSGNTPTGCTFNPPPETSRRRFLTTLAAAVGTASLPLASASSRPGLRSASAAPGQVGVTTSSFFRQMYRGAADRYFSLWDLPRVMRDELGMKVIDLNTGTLGGMDDQRIDRFRSAAADAGCIVSNLKVNLQMRTDRVIDIADLPFEHSDAGKRQPALARYKQWIEAAARLGAPWLRPFPAAVRPEYTVLVNSYRELADFGESRGVKLLVENGGWIQTDPAAIPRLVQALPDWVAAGPDIGSWADEVRYEALAKAFPHAVTCDFKVGLLGANGEHDAYNLRRCFDLGWEAGFRGPWCIEHAGAVTAKLFRELRWIKEQLEKWMKEAG